MIGCGRDDRVGEIGTSTVTGQKGKVKIPTLTSQNKSEDGIGLFPRR